VRDADLVYSMAKRLATLESELAAARAQVRQLQEASGRLPTAAAHAQQVSASRQWETSDGRRV
jgi:hypothetical protein